MNRIRIAVLASLLIASPMAHADLFTSSTDLFEGATVISASPTLGGFESFRMFQGASPEIEGQTLTIFGNVGLGNVAFVNFAVASVTTVNSLRLAAAHDFENTSRAMNHFRLFADVDADNIFETLLIDQAIFPSYVNQPGNNASHPRELDLTFHFGAVTAQNFRAEFVEGTNFATAGVRVMELDAFFTNVPEPSSAALLGLFGGAGALGFSRRRQSC